MPVFKYLIELENQTDSDGVKNKMLSSSNNSSGISLFPKHAIRQCYSFTVEPFTMSQINGHLFNTKTHARGVEANKYAIISYSN